MALDANLFSYELRVADGVTALYAGSNDGMKKEAVPTYRYASGPPPGFHAELADGLVDVILASVTAESLTAESKSVRLYDPDSSVALRRRAPSIYHDWRFAWDGQTYQWRKELRLAASASYSCTALRTSDPDIAIAMYRPASRNSPAVIQVLDYNVDRMETRDRRGFEAVLIISLMILLDLEAYNSKRQKRTNARKASDPNLPTSPARTGGANGARPSPIREISAPPPTPPRVVITAPPTEQNSPQTPQEVLTPQPQPIQQSHPPQSQNTQPPQTPPRRAASHAPVSPPQSPSVPRTPQPQGPHAPLTRQVPPVAQAHEASQSLHTPRRTTSTVHIGAQGVSTYVNHIIPLLDTHGPQYVVLVAETRELAGKAIAVAAETKDTYSSVSMLTELPPGTHQRGLFQYVLLGKSEVSNNSSRRRSSGYGADYVPPQGLHVVLSTQPIPELELQPARAA